MAPLRNVLIAAGLLGSVIAWRPAMAAGAGSDPPLASSGAARLSIAQAERMVTEVITLGYLRAADVIAVVKPIAGPAGSVTGLDNKLVVRAPAAAVREIRQVLATLDRTPSNLLITVRRELDRRAERDSARGSLRLGSERGTVVVGPRGAEVVSSPGTRGGISARVQSTRSRQSEQGVRRIKVLEGRWALLRDGAEVPVGQRDVVVSRGARVSVVDSVRYEDATQALHVRARIVGDEVLLEIATGGSRLSNRGGGRLEVMQADTVVTGTLGRWFLIGGTRADDSGRSGGIALATRERVESDDQFYVKVERAD